MARSNRRRPSKLKQARTPRQSAGSVTAAVLPRFLARSEGAIVNVASGVALAPEIPFGIYGTTKSYVLALSEFTLRSPESDGRHQAAIEKG
jgi:short-subunit dehydrogenase involved in D-alanine esterification of teichoic acids